MSLCNCIIIGEIGKFHIWRLLDVRGIETAWKPRCLINQGRSKEPQELYLARLLRWDLNRTKLWSPRRTGFKWAAAKFLAECQEKYSRVSSRDCICGTGESAAGGGCSLGQRSSSSPWARVRLHRAALQKKLHILPCLLAAKASLPSLPSHTWIYLCHFYAVPSIQTEVQERGTFSLPPAVPHCSLLRGARDDLGFCSQCPGEQRKGLER